MKKILLIIVSTLCSLSIYSQQVPNQYTENITLTDHNGVTHDITAYLNNGKYVVFDFFFTTCTFCQGELPDIIQLYRDMGCNEADVIVIGLEVQPHDDAHDIDWFINEFGVPYPIAPLENNAVITDLLTDWQIEGAPTYVGISPDRSMRELQRPPSADELVQMGAERSACPENWPIADFEADRTLIPAGESVMFSDLSTGAAEWNWVFYNGNPNSSNVQIPAPVVYDTPGEYTVKLTIKNEHGNEATSTKTNYIKVIEPATEPPTAYFAANQVTVIAGSTINFTDLSQGNPYIWQWAFQGAQPTISSEQNPNNIRYNSVGTFDVQLIVENNLGSDTLLIEDYIHVIPSIGDEVPNAKFTCSSRLVKVNTPVFFEDQSDGYPMHWSWEFEGGNPATSEFQNLPQGVVYENSGVYNVTLAVSNTNGGDILTKQDYIVVYENYVGSYCDTVCNLQENETVIKLSSHEISEGYLGGHNSDGITTYADKFEYYTYNEISSIVVPIMTLEYTNENDYITFYTWDGNDPVPTTVLSEQIVYLRDLSENYFQKIDFSEPLKVDGPFYLGYSINYTSGTNVVIGLSHNRGYGRLNTLFVHKDGQWKSLPEAYDRMTASTGIKVLTCLVGIEDVEFDTNINLFPNPCASELTIENSYGFERNDFIEIFDNLGRLVYSNYSLDGNIIEVNTQNLATGTYLTRIFTQGKVAVKKFEKID